MMEKFLPVGQFDSRCGKCSDPLLLLSGPPSSNCQERYNNTRGRDFAMVRVLALCRNAILYANEKGPCQLLLSDTHNGDSPRLLYLYKRWVSSIYTIKGDGSGSYLIRSSNNLGVAKSARTKLAKYSIALQYLVYEGITEDEEQSDE